LKKVREFLNSMFAVLSTGQQFRAALARTPAEALTDRRLVVFDEYTSVVDRTVAQTCSYALQKTVRRHKLQCIAVTCHDDVIDWLQPDWTYEPAENRFAWRLLRCRPSIPLHIVRCTTSAWPLFAPHHYLSGHINRSSVCFLASWQDRPVAFSAWLPFVGQGPLTRREHRTVVLPDYQGVGVGMAVSALIASMWKAPGLPRHQHHHAPRVHRRPSALTRMANDARSRVDRRRRQPQDETRRYPSHRQFHLHRTRNGRYSGEIAPCLSHATP
jgi:GNAT superfamily N-acetyltransferase